MSVTVRGFEPKLALNELKAGLIYKGRYEDAEVTFLMLDDPEEVMVLILKASKTLPGTFPTLRIVNANLTEPFVPIPGPFEITPTSGTSFMVSPLPLGNPSHGSLALDPKGVPHVLVTEGARAGQNAFNLETGAPAALSTTRCTFYPSWAISKVDPDQREDLANFDGTPTSQVPR